jgi:predicted DNA-binding transcriptional regulator AlpA
VSLRRSPTDLHVLRPAGPVEPPTNRGRLLNAAQVAAELLGGTVSPAWVRRHVPAKLVLGHSTVRWFETDVQAWLEARRAGASVGVSSY